MVEKEFLLQALEDAGYSYEVGEHLNIRGYSAKADAEIKVNTPLFSYDIGFRKHGDTYECIADWEGIHGISHREFLNKISQRYAYHTTRHKLEEQGFSLISDDVEEGNRIHLRLRRIA
jgi:hypothetical protein